MFQAKIKFNPHKLKPRRLMGVRSSTLLFFQRSAFFVSITYWKNLDEIALENKQLTSLVNCFR